jgi:hypothetical protein
MPLVFHGKKIAESDAEPEDHKGKRRWHELTLYQHDKGEYVASVSYFSDYPRDIDHHCAYVSPTKEGIVAMLRSHNPSEGWTGLPKTMPDWEIRQAAASAQIAAAYTQAVENLVFNTGWGEDIPSCQGRQ